MNYYKATRPDGTDFFTGSIDYAAALKSGDILVHPEKFVRNDPATYFSVAIAPTNCTGMRWSCRLFRVEPVGRVRRNNSIVAKRCCSRLRVVEELPAHEALGPQGAEVAALIERCKTLTADEATRLAVAWDAAREAARVAAREAARNAAWDAAWDVAWDAASALLTRDLITAEQFDLLYGPWRDVIDNSAMARSRRKLPNGWAISTRAGRG